MPIEEVIRLFDLCDINKNNARFDDKKLAYMNAAYVKNMPLVQFLERGKSLLSDFDAEAHYVDQVLMICQEKLRSFVELNHFVSYFFDENFDYDKGAWSDLRKRDPIMRIGEFLSTIENMEDISEQKLEEVVTELAEGHGIKTGDYIHGVRFALSGRAVGPSFYKMVVIMGRERIVKRLRRALVELEKWQ
jgi:glutamyl-tRNA synthetase